MQQKQRQKHFNRQIPAAATLIQVRASDISDTSEDSHTFRILVPLALLCGRQIFQFVSDLENSHDPGEPTPYEPCYTRFLQFLWASDCGHPKFYGRSRCWIDYRNFLSESCQKSQYPEESQERSQVRLLLISIASLIESKAFRARSHNSAGDAVPEQSPLPGHHVMRRDTEGSDSFMEDGKGRHRNLGSPQQNLYAWF